MHPHRAARPVCVPYECGRLREGGGHAGEVDHLKIYGRYDVGEIYERCRGDVGEIQGRCGGDMARAAGVRGRSIT